MNGDESVKSTHLAIIGGGASGLSAAIEALRTKPDTFITIFDRMPKMGKKILATGNGRCNFSNEDLSPAHFYGNSEFLKNVLTSPYSDDEGFFREMGMLSYHEDGRIYPRSQQASTVREALVNAATAPNVRFIYDTTIDSIEKKKDTFIIDGNHYDAVIVCGGGCASPSQGSNGSCYALAKMLGHTITLLYPALCGLTTSDKAINLLKGVRCECKAYLYCDGTLKGEEDGEVQFTDKGISGIPVMNLSHLCRGFRAITLSLDLCHDISSDELKTYLSDAIRKAPNKETEEILNGILNSKLSYAVMSRAGITAHTPAGKLKSADIQAISSIMKSFEIAINGTRGFDNAQVTCGGINTDEINPKTMMSRLSDGIFFAGEILDIHGDCGGYNLHLAFTTGRIAGVSAAEYLKNKESI